MSVSRTSDGSFVRNEDEKKGNFRFFQEYTPGALWTRILRDPGVSFFTRGLTIKSLKQFSVVDKEGKEHKHNKTIRKAIAPFFPQIWAAIQSDLAAGYGMLSFTKTEVPAAKTNGETETEEIDLSKTFKIEGFWKDQIDFKHDRFGDISYLSGTKNIKDPEDGVTEPKIFHAFGKDTVNLNASTAKPIDLKFSKFIGSIPGKNIGDYIPWLKAIWDDLYGWNVISSSAIVFAIRNGAGQWVVYAKSSFLKENMETMKDGVKGTSAEDSFIAFPLFQDSEGKQVELTSLSGDQIDFGAIKEIILGRISMATYVPKSRIEGITQGAQAGEVFIDKELSEAKQMRQDKYHYVPFWCVERISEQMNLEMGKDWDISFDKREELSTRGAAEVLVIQLKNFEIMRKYMDLKTAASKAGLEDWQGITLKEPEPLDLTPDPDKPEALDNQKGNGEPKPGDSEENLLTEDMNT